MDVEFRHRELFAFACEAYSRVILQEDRKSRMARCSSSHGRTSGGKGWVDYSASARHVSPWAGAEKSIQKGRDRELTVP